ncbi:hypothetical protein [Motilimonas eburnea]|uniref:hypothetical protein n=1 Tax=Motilimonas eburnea TaxID=1737488 RepID=UPI001E453F57|nr:hypothetical protein [Motilimonas eburnea]MCE2572355.1 hypothetical protein [Motilimonas eburnea]
MSETIGMSATEWRHMYFAGITKQSVNQIDLTQAQMSGLLSMVNLNAVISSGTAVEPQYLINQKGTTPWLAMYALVNVNDPTALNLVANGKSRIHVPSTFIQGAFGEHINWPVEMLNQYDLSLGEYRMFAIPFLVHQGVGEIGNLAQSMKAPDGSLELFGVYEWTDTDPEGLLKDFAELASFIKDQRSDAIQ